MLIEYKNHNIEITEDQNAENPNDWGGDEFLIFDHRNFYVSRPGFDAQDIFADYCLTDKQTYKGYFFFPVEAHIHGGVVLAIKGEGLFPDRQWDVSFKGFVLVKRQKGTYTKEKAKVRAGNFLEDWNTYLSGDVWYYVIIDESDKFIDSCGGWYGQESCIEAAKEQIDYLYKEA